MDTYTQTLPYLKEHILSIGHFLHSVIALGEYLCLYGWLQNATPKKSGAHRRQCLIH
jgi:hypothetical protein